MPKSGSLNPERAGGRCALALAGALAAAASGAAEPAARSCEHHPLVQGTCFNVYGRARLYGAAPAVRIWAEESRRTLAVGEGKYSPPGYANLPPELAKLVRLKRNVWGDFRVCPFEPERPGAMQFVCVESVTHIRLGPITQPAKRGEPPESARQ